SNRRNIVMSDWLHALPVVWMALMVFGATYLVAAGIYFAVSRLAAGGRARSFKAVSPGMLPPLGLVFGLVVAFIGAQVWNDSDRQCVRRAPAAHRHQPLAGQCGEVGVPYSAGDLRSHRDRDGA